MPKEVSQEEFDRVQAENRHVELMQSLEDIIRLLNKDKKEKVMPFVDNQVSELLKEIRVLLSQNKNVSLPVGIMTKTEKTLTDIKTSLTSKPAKWEFTVHRNPSGYINSVTATAKT